MNTNYNPRIGGTSGKVGNDDFSIDGKSWEYRNPSNFNDGNDRASEAPTYNKDANSLTNPLYDYSYGQVRDAAKTLGIGNVNSQDEVTKLISHIQNPVTESTDKSNKYKSNKQSKKGTAPAAPVYESETMRLAKERSARYDAGMTPSPFASSSNSDVLNDAISSTINNSSVTPQSNAKAQGFMKDFKDKYSFKPVFNS